MLKALLFSLFLLPVMIFGQPQDEQVSPVATELKLRMPEWRPHLEEQYPHGGPKLVLFYAENDAGEEVAVKRIHFYENGQPLEEADLIKVEESSPGYEFWQDTIVPHGVSIHFRETGEVEKMSYFDRGLLHGPTKAFYPSGQLQHLSPFKQGIPHGKICSYHENGQVAGEGLYQEGELEGDYLRYYPSGGREALVPYTSGDIHGKVVEWYENGNEKTLKYYSKGKLQSLEGQPAIIKYDKNHSIVEAQDFHQGIPSGEHIKYHGNERESYHVRYDQGKKHGKEEWFSIDGKLMGECEYTQGKNIGKHWKKHSNGTISFLATYDRKGRLKEPIREFAENGQRIAEYSKNLDEKLEGPYQSWYSTGQPESVCHYINGELEGKVTKFYPSGQMKLEGFYKDLVKEGAFKEWNEEGVLIFEGSFKEGNKEGTFRDWYSDGQLKTRSCFN